MKRVIATLSVEDEVYDIDVANVLTGVFPDSDPTVWDLPAFFEDVSEGLVTAEGDLTAGPHPV